MELPFWPAAVALGASHHARLGTRWVCTWGRGSAASSGFSGAGGRATASATPENMALLCGSLGMGMLSTPSASDVEADVEAAPVAAPKRLRASSSSSSAGQSQVPTRAMGRSLGRSESTICDSHSLSNCRLKRAKEQGKIKALQKQNLERTLAAVQFSSASRSAAWA